MDRAELVLLDNKHVWHPFTQHADPEASDHLVIVRGDGCELTDVDGRVYLDGISSLWVSVFGHRHPIVDRAVQDQLETLAHSTMLGLTHPLAIELARRLAEVTPEGLERVFYSDSGSTCVEVALKMAFQWHQQQGDRRRHRFVALREAYHGDTIGSVSVGGIDLFHAVYKPLLFDAVHLDAPLHREDEEELVQRALRTLDAVGDELAAIVVEPLVQGAAGMRMHSPAYLRPIVERARELGALVVFDEVAVGFGRTGTLFASEQVGFAPDFLCLAKGLTNGYLPLAVTMTTDSVYRGFLGRSEHTFFHGHTYTGNPLACAAALATLDLFRDTDVLETLSGKAAVLREALGRLVERHPERIREVRQTGTMVGIELVAFDGEERLGRRVCLAARDHGVILRNLGDVVVLMPPLVMTPDQLRAVVGAVDAVLSGAPFART